MRATALIHLFRFVCAFCGLMLLSVPAKAQVISVYSDSWTANVLNGDGSMTMYGYGDADSGGETGRLGLSVVMYDPSWTVLTTEGGVTRDGYISSQTSITIGWSSPEGTYRVEAAADWEFNHYDCSFTPVGIGKFVSHYYYYQQNGSQHQYLLEQDSTGLRCSHLGYFWSQYEPTGMSDKGYYSLIAGIGACAGKCYAGKTGTASGEAGTPVNSIPSCN